MTVCHLILLMPLLAIPLFWLWPVSTAVPVYSAVLILSGWVYLLVFRAMKRSVKTGSEEILQSVGEVIEVENNIASVQVHSEIWQAESSDKLQKGDLVKVVGIKGLTLKVKHI
ncbi:NfeD family protein [Sulfuriflexus sp.]|uniref:NfeD family protein n=1 Tax=Sulfuriflexus sp. TaxID=2015443 RepID=UPI0028CE5E95|nr:NfeD family protein [Sulfuriflexus sp.]MDT8403197.1 NfeD family protein [Sulfuriflexus sp.]